MWSSYRVSRKIVILAGVIQILLELESQTRSYRMADQGTSPEIRCDLQKFGCGIRVKLMTGYRIQIYMTRRATGLV